MWPDTTFMEPVVSQLAYSMTSRRFSAKYTGFMIDDQRLVGMKVRFSRQYLGAEGGGVDGVPSRHANPTLPHRAELGVAASNADTCCFSLLQETAFEEFGTRSDRDIDVFVF